MSESVGTHHISELEKYCHDQAGIYPKESPRWLFIHFLDELLRGYLAYKPLSGEVHELDEILNHYFWVVGTLDGEAYYSAYSRQDEDVPPTARDWMKEQIQELMSCKISTVRACEIMEYFNCQTVAAISFGHDGDDWNIQMLYWHPYFPAHIAEGLLKESVQTKYQS